MAFGSVNIGGKNKATDISYDNSKSGIAAENVQDALDTGFDIVLPTLTVTVDSGSEITLTDGEETITGTAGADGTFTTRLLSLGTWTATATLDGQTTTGSIDITALGNSYSLMLAYFSATLTVTAVAGAAVTAASTDATYTATAGSNGKAVIPIKRSGSYTISATIDGIPSNNTTVNVTSDGGSYTATIQFITLTVEVDSGSTITVTDGTHTYTKAGTGSDTWYLPNTGTWTVTATKNGETASDSVSVTAYQAYTLELAYVKIYGVIWDGSASTALTRTDDAALFTDPVPSVGGSEGSSPFDNCMPWKGMTKVVDSVGGTLVKIPKFWYRWAESTGGLALQIADHAVDGFHVSPSHADRGDGHGERDYVYIGRYKCDGSYKSTGSNNGNGRTRADARSGIAALGTGYYQQDFALFWTIRMLYLVEFANWNTPSSIMDPTSGGEPGMPTTPGSNTDSMSYHTGKSSNTSSAQYRWIESLCSSTPEWCDGIYFGGADVYIINNPEKFSDNSDGTRTGTRPASNGYIRSWGIPSLSGLEWALYPNSVDGASENTYIPDKCYFKAGGGTSTGVGSTSGGTTLAINAGYFAVDGMFALTSMPASKTTSGARLQKLP